jgi:hypothetical protein
VDRLSNLTRQLAFTLPVLNLKISAQDGAVVLARGDAAAMPEPEGLVCVRMMRPDGLPDLLLWTSVLTALGEAQALAGAMEVTVDMSESLALLVPVLQKGQLVCAVWLEGVGKQLGRYSAGVKDNRLSLSIRIDESAGQGIESPPRRTTLVDYAKLETMLSKIRQSAGSSSEPLSSVRKMVVIRDLRTLLIQEGEFRLQMLPATSDDARHLNRSLRAIEALLASLLAPSPKESEGPERVAFSAPATDDSRPFSAQSAQRSAYLKTVLLANNEALTSEALFALIESREVHALVRPPEPESEDEPAAPAGGPSLVGLEFYAGATHEPCVLRVKCARRPTE